MLFDRQASQADTAYMFLQALADNRLHDPAVNTLNNTSFF